MIRRQVAPQSVAVSYNSAQLSRSLEFLTNDAFGKKKKNHRILVHLNSSTCSSSVVLYMGLGLCIKSWHKVMILLIGNRALALAHLLRHLLSSPAWHCVWAG